MSDKDLKGRAAIEEIDRRLGGLLGPLAEGLAKVVDAAEKAQGEASRDGVVQTRRGPVTVRSGFSVRVGGLAGETEGRDPAQPRAAGADAARPQTAEPTEPQHDLFETETRWTLTADMPGAAPEALSVTVVDGCVVAEVGGRRPWRLRAPAPDWVRDAALETHLANGVLSVDATRESDT